MVALGGAVAVRLRNGAGRPGSAGWSLRRAVTARTRRGPTARPKPLAESRLNCEELLLMSKRFGWSAARDRAAEIGVVVDMFVVHVAGSLTPECEFYSAGEAVAMAELVMSEGKVTITDPRGTIYAPQEFGTLRVFWPKGRDY